MRVLVTGAAGFIGSHLVTSLLRSGHEVFGVDNLNSYYDIELKRARIGNLQDLDESSHFELRVADISEPGVVDKCMDDFKPEAFVHLAAQAGVRYSLLSPETYIASNIVGFFHVLEAVRRKPVRHLVYASSSSVYGRQDHVPFTETDFVDAPISLYAATKKSNELMAHSYSHLFGIPSTGLRFFTVYGPWGRPDMAYFSFTKAILADEEIRLFNHGAQRRDFTYIDDVVDGIERVLAQPPSHGVDGEEVPYRILNLGNHSPVPLREFVAILEKLLGKRAILALVDAQPGDVSETYADIRRAHDLVGFSPQWSLEAGLEEFVEWYLKYHGAHRWST